MSLEQTFNLETLQEYIQLQNEYIDKARSMKHDMASHLLVLKYYLADEKYEAATEYVNRLLNENEELQSNKGQLGNGLVDAVIAGTLQKSKEKICLRCGGTIPEGLHIEDWDMCTLFSNLMSNAVEACERLRVKEKVIEINLWEDGDTWYVRVENPVEWQVPCEIIGKGTTKDDSECHGYGIRNVKAVVKKYDGEIRFETSEQHFCAEIAFRNVVM